MEVTNEVSSDVSSEPVSSPVETPQKEAAPQADQSLQQKFADKGTEIGNGDAEKPEVPPFTPNFKFKVLDKEHEIDEWLRGSVKTPEQEKKIRELYEKSMGLEPVKQSRDKIAGELQQYQRSYNSLHQDVAEAMQHKNTGDLDAFFEKVQLPIDKVAEWMVQKLNIQNLPPEQQRIYNDLNAKKKSEAQLSRQLEAQTNENRQLATRQREWEVDQWLVKPDMNPIVSRFDSENGPGSFKNLVAELGVTHHATYGEDPTVETVVSKALKMLGSAYRNPQIPQASTAPGGEKQLPVIPNISGKNVSPTRKAVRSLDDLKKLQKEFTAEA